MTDRGTILVVDDDLTVCEIVCDFLESAGYDVRVVHDAGEVIPTLRKNAVDAVVLDSLIDDGQGLQLLAPIKELDPLLEVVVITELTGDDSAMTAVSQGASSYLQRPIRLPALLNRIRTATTTRSFFQHIRHLAGSRSHTSAQLKQHFESIGRLLRFDRELMSIMDYRRVLDAILTSIVTMAGASVSAVLLIRDKVPSVTVLPKKGSGCPSRDDLFAALTKEWETWGGHPFERETVMWTDYGEGTARITDVIVAPLVVHDALVGVMAALATDGAPLSADAAALVPIVAGRAEIVVENAFLHEHTKILATTDALTGLLNRRVFREGITREFERSRRIRLSKRSGGDLSVIMLDVDFFKNFNDTYGHQLGDKVLKMVATVLTTVARRATDMVARYGGEEFVIVAPDTSLENATSVAERIRQMLRATPVDSSSGPLHVAASFGVAAYPTCGATNVETLIEQSDEALYRAKRNGRDRVEAAPAVSEPQTGMPPKSS